MSFIKIFISLFKKNKPYNAPLQYEYGSKYEKNPLPPWQEIVEKCYGKEVSNIYEYTVEKVIYTKENDFRAVIYKKKDMYFIILEQLYAWNEEDEYEINEYLSGNGLPGYWFPIDNGVSVFDSIETAEKEIFAMAEFKNEEM